MKKNLVKILNDLRENFGQNLKGLVLLKILKDLNKNLGFWSKSDRNLVKILKEFTQYRK